MYFCVVFVFSRFFVWEVKPKKNEESSGVITVNVHLRSPRDLWQIHELITQHLPKKSHLEVLCQFMLKKYPPSYSPGSLVVPDSIGNSVYHIGSLKMHQTKKCSPFVPQLKNFTFCWGNRTMSMPKPSPVRMAVVKGFFLLVWMGCTSGNKHVDLPGTPRAPGWLGFFGGWNFLPNYMGIRINQYKDPY